MNFDPERYYHPENFEPTIDEEDTDAVYCKNGIYLATGECDDCHAPLCEQCTYIRADSTVCGACRDFVF